MDGTTALYASCLSYSPLSPSPKLHASNMHSLLCRCHRAEVTWICETISSFAQNSFVDGQYVSLEIVLAKGLSEQDHIQNAFADMALTFVARNGELSSYTNEYVTPSENLVMGNGFNTKRLGPLCLEGLLDPVRWQPSFCGNDEVRHDCKYRNNPHNYRSIVQVASCDRESIRREQNSDDPAVPKDGDELEWLAKSSETPSGLGERLGCKNQSGQTDQSVCCSGRNTGG